MQIYVAMHVHAEATKRCQVSSSIASHLIPFRQGLALNPELSFQRGWPASKMLGFSFCLPVLGFQACVARPSFAWVLGIKTQVLRLAKQILLPTGPSFHSSLLYSAIQPLPQILNVLFNMPHTKKEFALFPYRFVNIFSHTFPQT